jgi:hypothetical protein
MKISIIFFLSLFISTVAFASEVDSYHSRLEGIKDSTEAINQFSNNLFNQVLEKTNKNSQNCNEVSLFHHLRKEFHNGLQGHFNKFISTSDEVERKIISTEDSVYGSLTPKDSIVLGFYSKYITDPLASAINIRGHFVGTDKFEHFTGTGFRYFRNYYYKHQSIDEIVNIGTKAENGIMGAFSTGVISYGDMAAEFNGMRFWNNVLAKNPDVLGETFGPYVICKNNQWVKNKEIDFSKFVDDSWDEGINCSKFRTDKIFKKVISRIRRLESLTNSNFTCPIKPNSLNLIRIKYGIFSQNLLNAQWAIR